MIDKIEGMGIYELRNFARELGVHSPTTLKRDELIKQISGILSGEIVVSKTTSSRGRPPRAESLSSILKNSFNEDLDSQYDLDKYNFLFINQVESPSPIYVDTLQNTNKKQFIKEGIVEVLAGGNARLITIDNFDLDTVYINADLVNKYQLKSGMEISIICYKTNDSHIQFIATSIDENCLPKEDIDFLKLKNMQVESPIKVNNTFEGYSEFNKIYPICKGQKGLVVCDKEISYNATVCKLAGAFENVRLISILSSDQGLEQSPKDFETLFYQSTETLSRKARKFEIIIDIAKRGVERGEDVVLFIGNLSNLFKTYFQMFLTKGLSEAIAKEDAVQILKYFLNLSKQSEKGSLTMLVLARTEDDILKEFSDVINYSLKLTIVDKNYDCIDFKKSFSVNNIIDYSKIKEKILKFDNLTEN